MHWALYSAVHSFWMHRKIQFNRSFFFPTMNGKCNEWPHDHMKKVYFNFTFESLLNFFMGVRHTKVNLFITSPSFTVPRFEWLTVAVKWTIKIFACDCETENKFNDAVLHLSAHTFLQSASFFLLSIVWFLVMWLKFLPMNNSN